MEGFSDLFASLAIALYEMLQEHFDKTLKDSRFYSKRWVKVLSYVLSTIIVLIIMALICLFVYAVIKLIKG